MDLNYDNIDMLEFRPEDHITVPTKQGMIISNVHYISCSRTTLCDIMCTVNASVNFDIPVAPEKLQPLEATLPYKKTQRQNPMKAKVTNATIFQKFKLEGNKSLVVEELKRDKEIFMHKLQLEKLELDNKKYRAAVMFQALYRGYKSRPPPINYIRKKKRKYIPRQFELHDELCALASTLGLKPVNGLSLEPRGKSSRRREKILNAAAFRITRFIAMIVARNNAKILVEMRKEVKINKSACVVTRAIRYVKVKKFVKKCESVKRDRCATKIQNRIRIFFAKHRVRELKKLRMLNKKYNEAAIIIQRNFASKYRVNDVSRVTRLALRHVVRLCNNVLDDISDVLLNDAISTCLEFYLKHIVNKTEGTVVKAIDLLIEDIVLDIASGEIQVWYEENLHEIALENLNALRTERILLEASIETMEANTVDILQQSINSVLPTTVEVAVENEGITSTIEPVFAPDHHHHHVEEKMIEQQIKDISVEITNDNVNSSMSIFNITQFLADFIENIIDTAIAVVNKKSSTWKHKDVPQGKQVMDNTKKIAIESQTKESITGLLENHRKLVTDFVSASIASALDKLRIVVPIIITEEMVVENSKSSSISNEQQVPVITVVEDNLDADDMSAVSMPLDHIFDDDASIISAEEGVIFDQLGEVIEEWEITRYFLSVNLTTEEKKQIDILFKKAYQAFYYGKYDQAWAILDKFPPVLALFPTTDVFHPDVARLHTAIKILQGMILFAQAQYTEAKLLYDEALKDRLQVYGANHFLTVEVNYHLCEWYRSQAMYNEGEQILIQICIVMEALLKQENENIPLEDLEGRVDVSLWHLHNKILICHAESLKHCGQYYKSNYLLLKVQESLKLHEFKDFQTVRIQESFISCVVSMLLMNGKFANALVLQNELLRKRKSRFQSMQIHPQIATSMCSLGNLKLLRCEFEEAARLIEESLEIRKKIYRSDHPAIAASLCARGKAFMKLGRYGEATADITLSLELRLSKLGAHHPSVAESVLALASVQTQSGDSLRAWKNHIYALQTYRDKYGVEKHRDVGNCIFEMGCNALERGSYIEAVSYFEEAVRVREALIPMLTMYSSSDKELKRSVLIDRDNNDDSSTHLAVEIAKLFLARAYLFVSRMEDCKVLMKSAVKNITNIVGSQNDLTALGLLFLGDECKARGNLLDAKQLYGVSFEIIQGLFGDDHPMLATLMLASADNLQFPGYYAEAQELIQTALEVRSLVFGSNNIHTSLAVFQKAQLLFQMGKITDAEELYIHAMHILIAKLGENNGLYGWILGEFADCCRIIGKHNLAEKYFHQAIEIQKNNFGDKSIRMHLSICNYTFLLLDHHQPNDAYNILMNTVLPCFVEHLGLNHPYTLYVKANAALALQFSAFFEKQGTSEASQILDGIMKHPDILILIENCHNAKFSPSHPWLLRFKDADEVSEVSDDHKSLKDKSPRPGSVRKDRSISPPRKHREQSRMRSQLPDDHSVEIEEQPSLNESNSSDSRIVDDYRNYVMNSANDDNRSHAENSYLSDDFSTSSYYRSKYNTKDDISEEGSQYSRYSQNIYSRRNYSEHIDYEDDLSYDSYSITITNKKSNRNYIKTPINIKPNDELSNKEISVVDKWDDRESTSLSQSLEYHSHISQSIYEDERSLISYGMDSYYSK